MTFFYFLVFTSGKFLEALGNEIGTGLVFFPFILIFEQCVFIRLLTGISATYQFNRIPFWIQNIGAWYQHEKRKLGNSDCDLIHKTRLESLLGYIAF